MDTRIPTSALVLGLSGLIPFLWGAFGALVPSVGQVTGDMLGPSFAGTALLQSYGIVILAFMSGVIWGFATRAEGGMATAGYALSVLPALWAYFLGTAPGATGLIALAVGFAALLVLDYGVLRQGLAPPWWMRLRLLLTSIVTVCLMIGALV